MNGGVELEGAGLGLVVNYAGAVSAWICEHGMVSGMIHRSLHSRQNPVAYLEVFDLTPHRVDFTSNVRANNIGEFSDV